MYEESYDEAVDVYAFGMCMLEMATSEYPYNECLGPAQIYKKVVHGIKPVSFEKIENPEVKDIIDRCTKLKKTERPSCLELLNSDFFSEDLGIKLEPITKQQFLIDPTCNKIEFRLRLMDPKKRTSKHKENEAIQFDFDISNDNANQIASEMFKSNIINEEDSKAVSKLIQVQVSALIKQRREMMAQHQLDIQKTHYRAKALRTQQILAFQAAKEVEEVDEEDEDDEDHSSSDYDEECTQAMTIASDEHDLLLQKLRENMPPAIHVENAVEIRTAGEIESCDKIVRIMSDETNIDDGLAKMKLLKHKKKSAIKNSTTTTTGSSTDFQQQHLTEFESDEIVIKASVQFRDQVQFENEVMQPKIQSSDELSTTIQQVNIMPPFATEPLPTQLTQQFEEPQIHYTANDQLTPTNQPDISGIFIDQATTTTAANVMVTEMNNAPIATAESSEINRYVVEDVGQTEAAATNIDTNHEPQQEANCKPLICYSHNVSSDPNNIVIKFRSRAKSAS